MFVSHIFNLQSLVYLQTKDRHHSQLWKMERYFFWLFLIIWANLYPKYPPNIGSLHWLIPRLIAILVNYWTATLHQEAKPEPAPKLLLTALLEVPLHWKPKATVPGRPNHSHNDSIHLEFSLYFFQMTGWQGYMLAVPTYHAYRNTVYRSVPWGYAMGIFLSFKDSPSNLIQAQLITTITGENIYISLQ